MPNSLQTLDTSFPKIDDHQTTEENFLQVTNYLYMLLENLRYTLGNLGEENFNDTELDDIAKMIREPVWARIEDAEGNINSLNITANSLSSQISDINGNVSSLTQTSQTLISRIQTAEGDISSLTQTANSLNSKISDAEGNISSLTQTVNGMTLSVSNSGTSSTIKLMQNGVAISSQNIVMSGVVTFSDLSTAGSTTINGSNITTGIVNANRIYGGTLTGVEVKGVNVYGSKYFNTDGKTWMEVGKDLDGVDNDAYALYVSSAQYSNTGVFSIFNGDVGIVTLDAKGFTFMQVDADDAVKTVKIYVGSLGKYWEFSSSGIFFKDAQGVQTNRVKLEN